MRNCSKTKQKRLAKFVLAALMCTGGGLYNLSPEVYAAEATVTHVTGTAGSYDVTSDPPGSVIVTSPSTSNTFYAPAADVLNITGTFAGSISFCGGYSSGTGVSGKTVNINGANISVTEICGGWDTSGSVEGNTVNVASGTVALLSITGAYGSSTSGNHVNITGGAINYSGYGCYLYGGDSASGNAENNTVTISGGELTPISTGDATSPVKIYGGYTSANGKSAKENVVTIKGNANTTGTTNLNVYGGYANGSDPSATDNVVTIDKEGISLNNIYGGYAMPTGLSTDGTATNNTVNILSQMTAANIYGGFVGDGGTSSGNTLNVAAKDVNVTGGVYYVQNMNFYLPANIASGDTMLTISGGDKTILDDVTIGVAAQTGVSLSKGDTVNLISNSAGFTGTAATTTLTTAPTATSLTLDTSYKFTINQGDTAVTATVTDKTESSTESSMERAKSLVETRAATTTFINAGADMLSSQGFMQAANAVALEAAEQTTSGAAGVPSVSTFTPFAAMGGSSMRAQSGSYVDTKGFGLNVGFAREISNAQGKLLFGPVVEYGGGSYDSYLEDAAGTHGEGGAHYYGLGIMARQVNHDGLYYEGSLRGGRVNSDYKSTMDTLGKVNYDSSSNYFAAHLGVGKAFSIGNGNTLDGYLKYFYSHQSGDTTTIHIENAADERGSFDAVDSHRLRIGARLTHKVNDRNSFYGGLAYQYEFGGEARAHFTSGGNVPSPSVKGGSGMLELGWQVKPGETPLTLDLGLTGWAGKQRGGSVQLGATWKF